MEAIGGYFELALRKGNHYHSEALMLNTGRNCLEYLILARQIRHIYLPYFTCEVLLEPISKLKVKCDFYDIDESLNPCLNKIIAEKCDAILVTDYFGVKHSIIKKLSIEYGTKLIVDNAQAFFTNPLPDTDTFYSPRKFFGIPDGAYLYTKHRLSEELEQDHSVERISHLLLRCDYSAEKGYDNFKKNENDLNNNPIRKMSKLTEKLLQSVDYEKAKKVRMDNFSFLHSRLKQINLYVFSDIQDEVPMVYPLMIDMPELRQKLIEQKIYIATYWPNVFEWCKEESNEYYFAKNILPLPIDQRYGIEEMNKIVNLILE